MARERAHATSKRGRDARQGAHEGGRSKTGCGICGGFARGSVTTAGFINEGADSSGQWAAWMSDRRCWGERQDSEWDQCTRPGDPCANVSTLGARPMAQSACGSHIQRANTPTHQRTRPPLRHHPTANLCDRLTLVCGACPLHTFCTPGSGVRCAGCRTAGPPTERPLKATDKRHRQTHHTSTAARCLPMAWAATCGAAACGPATSTAPVVCPTGAHMRMDPWQRPRRSIPAPCHADAAPPCPTPPCTALYRSGRHLRAPQRAVGVYTFGLSMGSPGSSTGGASSGGSIGSGFGSWSLLGSLGVVAMGCTSCHRYSATSVVLASAWASKRKG